MKEIEYTLENLIKSPLAIVKHIDNSPDDAAKDNLIWLKTYPLPRIQRAIRERHKTELLISSAYRCPTLNKAVGGVDNSYHTKGLAIDFTVKADNMDDVSRTIQTCKVPFDLLIIHRKKNYYHLQFDRLHPRARVIKDL